jgi:hypothetical protein
VTLKTYDPKQVVFTFANQVITGFAAGTIITATRTVDVWEMVSGGDGEITRIKNNDRSGLVTITLQQASASNVFLMSKITEDEIANTGLGPLLIRDFTSSAGQVAAANAFIKRVPDWGRATADETNVEWIFGCPILSIAHGGNIIAASLLPAV